MKCCAGFLLACGAACRAFAQTPDDASALQPVVVSASRTEQRLQDALPATTLITRADIERAQALDVPTLLRQVAGVEVTQSGPAGTQSSVFLRGAESRHTLVLVDGVPVNNLNFSTATLEHLALSNIERIEIVRGNVSSLYGSAALGGVIQIFTRNGAGASGFNVSAQAGSRGLAQAQAAARVELAPGTRMTFSAESQKDDGFNAIDQVKIPGTNPDIDGYRRRAFAFGLSQDVGRGAVELNVREATGVSGYDSEYGPADQADVSTSVLRSAVLSARFALGDAVWLEAAFNTNADKLNATVTAYPYFVNSFMDGSSLGVQWTIAPQQSMTAGIESTRQRIESDTVYNNSQRTLDSARLGYQAMLGDHQLQFNLRQDRYSDFGSASTWFAGYANHLSDAWRINASLSTGFNAPTFNDLYYPYGGNAALAPEKLQSRELGLQYVSRVGEARVVWFSNRFTDLIGNDENFNRVNISSARNDGLEWSLRANAGEVQWRASVTAQDPVNEDSGERLSGRAALLGQVGADTRTGAWEWGANLRFQGARANGPQSTKAMDAYSVIDLRGSRMLDRSWKLFGRIDNLLDARYETVYGYRQPPLGIFVGMSWSDAR